MFVAEGRSVAIGEIVLAALCREDLLPVWTRLLRMVECETRAGAADDDADRTPDDAELQSQSEQFRYDRELITAEETERWLEERGLTLEDFNAYCLRHYWADRSDDSEEPTPLEYSSATEEFWELLRAELLLSGELDRMAVALSWRFAAAHADRTGDEPTAASEPIEGALLDAADFETWIDWLGCGQEWVDELEALEASYQAHRDRLLTPDSIERTLKSLRLPLSRVDLETIDVDSLDAVHEIVMCVREDGRPMSEVATDGRLPYQRTDAMFEDLAPDLQQHVLAAAPGDVLAPMPHDDGFYVHRLLARADPQLGDDEVTARIEREVLSRHFSELSAACIRWVIAPSVTS